MSTAPTIPDTTSTTPMLYGGDLPLVDRLRQAELAIQACLAECDSAGAPVYPKSSAVEVSVVMPCLNEADTLEVCIRKAQLAIEGAGMAGEIIIADNGSTDGSQAIAERLGARVVPVAARGYGSALMGGIAASRGKYVVMGDADDSYDFGEVPRIVEQLRAGNELVQGCRLPSGGGTVLPGAMPVLHRWLGNPLFSFLARHMFQAPIHDVYCGLRGFTRALYDRLDLRATGMEFATEMIIKCSLGNVRTAEVPITLHPDGRKAHAPHLRTFRDGWRTLRFYLMYSPRWLFLMPGMLLAVSGLLGYALALPGVSVFGAQLDAHTLLVASLGVLVGSSLMQFALLAKTFAISEGLLPESPRMQWFARTFTLERGLIAGLMGIGCGLGLVGSVAWSWWQGGFGPLDYAVTMRWAIPGVLLVALGVQGLFASFLMSILRMARR